MICAMCLTPGCLGIVMPLSHVIIYRPPGCRHMVFSSSAIHFKTTTSLVYFNYSHHPIVMASTIQRSPTLPSGKAAVLTKNDNDVVIVAAVRSAMTKVLFDSLSSHFPC